MIRTMLASASVLTLCAAVSQAQAFEQLGAHEHGYAQLMIALEGKELSVVLESPAANLAGFEHKVRTEAQHKTVEKMLKTLRQGEMLALPASALCLLDKVEVKQSLLDEAAGHEGHDHDEHGHKEPEHKEHGHDEHKEHDHHEEHDDHDKHDHDEHDHDRHKEHGHEAHDHDHDKHDEHKEHADHGEHDHDAHDHDKHDGHDDHEGHDHGKEGGSHSDIEVSWHYHCMQPQKLNTINVKLFSAFSGLEKMDAQWAVPAGQGAKTLTPKDAELKF